MGCIDWHRVALRTADFIISAIVVLFMLTAGAYSVFALWDNSQVYAAVDNVQAELLQFKPSKDGDNSESFVELRKINSDVKAWLTMDETAIDYPVVQGESNLSYINTDVYGEFALAGSIFLDSANSPDFSDQYNLLYGHHMENSKMFGDLDLYKDVDFFEKNTTGILILPDRTYDLEVIACLVVASSEDAIFDVTQWTDDTTGLLEFARQSAVNIHEDTLAAVEASGGQVLAMSTCSSEYTDARTIVLAWMKPSATES